jgi:hypothetical protein
MKIKTINMISWIFVVISIILIIFACIAPLVFTQCSSVVDFTETGQIGDTIGGIMGPIVSIAGVFMTFIAFLMQVNANRIQSNQLKKTLDLKLLENKIDSRKDLQLMCIDANIMIDNIKTICNEIEIFCNLTNENPTGVIPFHYVSTKTYERYVSIDRNYVYNAFASFMPLEDYNKDFRDIYSLMDFYSDGLNMVYSSIFKPYNDDVAKIKEDIPSLFSAFIEAVNDKSLDNNRKLINLFNQQVNAKLINNGILNVLELHKILEDKKFNSLYEFNSKEFRELSNKVNSIINLNMMMVRDMKDAKNKLQNENNYKRLIEIKDKIEKVLSVYNIESIKDEFEKSV